MASEGEDQVHTARNTESFEGDTNASQENLQAADNSPDASSEGDAAYTADKADMPGMQTARAQRAAARAEAAAARAAAAATAGGTVDKGNTGGDGRVAGPETEAVVTGGEGAGLVPRGGELVPQVPARQELEPPPGGATNGGVPPLAVPGASQAAEEDNSHSARGNLSAPPAGPTVGQETQIPYQPAQVRFVGTGPSNPHNPAEGLHGGLGNTTP